MFKMDGLSVLLYEVHLRGVIHNDITNIENFRVDWNDPLTPQVMLLDFGRAQQNYRYDLPKGMPGLTESNRKRDINL